jgi:ABC-type amino acid transport substrate-binding protein
MSLPEKSLNVKPNINVQSKPQIIPKTTSYNFASIERLIEQEVGRIVLPQIYKNIGIDITVVPLPGQRAQFVANSGEKDGEIMRIWSYGDENEHVIRVATPYYYLETMPFSLKENKLDIRGDFDLKKFKLAIVRGVKHTNNITKGMDHVYEMNSTKNMFKMLRNGTVDVALTNTLDGKLTIERLGYENIESSNNALAVFPLYHYIYKKHKTLVPLINQEILRLKESGELQELIRIAENKVISLNTR